MLPDSGQTFSSFSTIFSKKTEFQEVSIIDTQEFGRVLLLDGVPQSSELDEFVYHEILVHLGMGLCSIPKKVLIIGGGEGAVIREVLKYKCVQQITMVDIDGELIEIAKLYLHQWHRGSYENPLVNLVVKDGREFVKGYKGKFDCIIIDLSDPFDGGPSQMLFSKEFYLYVSNILEPNGVVTLQAGNATFKKHIEHCRILKTLASVFPSVVPAYAYIPLFSSLYAFVICRKFNSNPIAETIVKNVAINDLDLDFLNTKTIQMILSIPNYISSEIISGSIDIITDTDEINPKVWKMD